MKFDSKITPRFFKAVFGKTSTDNYHPIIADPSTCGLLTSEHNDIAVHEGHYFRSGLNYTLANGNVAGFGMSIPNAGKEIHMSWEFTATANGVFTLKEDVTSFAGGATVTPLNHNRVKASTNPSITTCIKGMTGVSPITPTGGTTILNAILSTARGSSINRDTSAELILKPSSNYFWQYTNGTSANVIQLILTWHDHIPCVS